MKTNSARFQKILELSLQAAGFLALIAICVQAIYGFRAMEDSGSALYWEGVQQLALVAEAQVTLEQLEGLVAQATLEINGAALAKLGKEFDAEHTKMLELLASVATTAAEQERVLGWYTTFQQGAEQVFASSTGFAPGRALEIQQGAVVPMYQQLRDFLLEQGQTLEGNAAQAFASVQQTSQKFQQNLIVVCVVWLLVLGLAELYMARVARNQQRETKQMMAEIQQALTGMDRVTHQMSGEAGEMLSAAQSSGDKVNSVANVMADTSGSMGSVSAAVEELAATTEQIQKQASETSEIAGQAIQEIQHANAAVATMANSMQQIDQFVKIITDIAEQTNLLALNAAIEAARAGAAGRGFAVVADEVRKLANQTNQAADDIVTQVRQIQKVTGQVSGAIITASDTIGRMNEISDQVRRSVTEQNMATNDIARSVGEVSAGVANATSDVAMLDDVANRVFARSVELQSSTGNLETTSNQLKQRIRAFLDAVHS